MDDLPAMLRETLLAGDQADNTPVQNDNAVADLLVSQTETADIILLNKVDLVDKGDDLETIEQIAKALNAKATVQRTILCDVALHCVLAVATGKGVVEAGVVDDHRDAIQAVQRDLQSKPDSEALSHAAHEHTDASHDHSHSHGHTEECNNPDCTDTSHSHSHSHHTEACSDPDCTDSSHSHSHSHSSQSTTLDQLDIGSFVYRARKPFHPQRLVSFLRFLPISRGLPETTTAEGALNISDDAKKVLQTVVRSKGFVWLGDSNIAANYWSQAGSSFELQCLGRWWATLSRKEVSSK